MQEDREPASEAGSGCEVSSVMTKTVPLDVAANRATRKLDRRVQVKRVFWALWSVLFRLSLRPLRAWRRMFQLAFGAKIGHEVHVYPAVRITMPWNIEIGDQTAVGDRAILYALGTIRIGARSRISQGAHLCAGSHDISRLDRPLPPQSTSALMPGSPLTPSSVPACTSETAQSQAHLPW